MSRKVRIALFAALVSVAVGSASCADLTGPNATPAASLDNTQGSGT